MIKIQGSVGSAGFRVKLAKGPNVINQVGINEEFQEGKTKTTTGG